MSPTAEAPVGRHTATSGVLAAAVTVVLGTVVLGTVLLTTLATAASAQDDDERVATRGVRISHVDDDAVEIAPVVDTLDPVTVLVVQADGFAADRTGFIRQCVDTGAGPVCLGGLPVRFDDRGAATFQFVVTDAVAATVEPDRPCRLASSARCTIELTVGDMTSVVDTVFVDAAPAPGRVEVNPRTNVTLGQDVTVTASDFPPDLDLTITVCAAPATQGPRCGGPDATRSLRTGADGAASITFSLDVASVGSDEVACGRRTRCQIVVSSDQVGVRARPVVLGFRETPGASYDAGRLALGLLVAVVLGATAAWLVRRTDWSPPPEADGSLIDITPFADLDAEAEAFDARAARAGTTREAPV